MKNWEEIVKTFLENPEIKRQISGALVCGSYITGNPSTHSDIDIHLITKKNIKRRKRGNLIIDGVLIEYFMNSKNHIKSYFEDDFSSNTTSSLVQFATGKIIFDNNKEVFELKKLAKKILNNKLFPKLNKFKLEISKYSIWDMLDNLEDEYENNQENFKFMYYNSLKILYEKYAKFLQQPITNYKNIFMYLTDQKSREKYLYQQFPDKFFETYFKQAMVCEDKNKMLELYKTLTFHCLDKMGGFEIDGRNIKS